jgi:hypothetical protein
VSRHILTRKRAYGSEIRDQRRKTTIATLSAQSGDSRSDSHQIGTHVKLEIVQSAGVGFILRVVDLG